ncbi:MAG: hypothetical protein ACKPKO_46330 [Candidatus Fonsibacter sp.]
MSANGSTALQQNTLRRALELLQSVGAINNGVNNVINSIVTMIGTIDDPTDPLHPTLTFYFVRMAETLATYVTMYEHIRSSATNNIQRSDDARLGSNQS